MSLLVTPSDKYSYRAGGKNGFIALLLQYIKDEKVNWECLNIGLSKPITAKFMLWYSSDMFGKLVIILNIESVTAINNSYSVKIELTFNRQKDNSRIFKKSLYIYPIYTVEQFKMRIRHEIRDVDSLPF